MDIEASKQVLIKAWPKIVEECRAVLGGELHYQAVVYHCLRDAGCPRGQIGMNVKQMILEPVTELFRSRDVEKNEAFRGGFEPIPDIVLFAPEIAGNWQRRNAMNTLRHMLCAIEIKASEREGRRLRIGEIRDDIAKLAAHRDEVVHRDGQMYPVMMVIDVATEPGERMTAAAVDDCAAFAASNGVGWLYASPSEETCTLH